MLIAGLIVWGADLFCFPRAVYGEVSKLSRVPICWDAMKFFHIDVKVWGGVPLMLHMTPCKNKQS